MGTEFEALKSQLVNVETKLMQLEACLGMIDGIGDAVNMLHHAVLDPNTTIGILKKKNTRAQGMS